MRRTPAALLLLAVGALWNCGGRSPIEAYGKGGPLGEGKGGSDDGNGGTGSARGGDGGSGGSSGCGGKANLLHDPFNCGACGVTCGVDHACYEGGCVPVCSDTCDGV